VRGLEEARSLLLMDGDRVSVRAYLEDALAAAAAMLEDPAS
jgi:hypothetical protein